MSLIPNTSRLFLLQEEHQNLRIAMLSGHDGSQVILLVKEPGNWKLGAAFSYKEEQVK